MSHELANAEKLTQAARLVYEAESLDMADLLCREATRLARKAVAGETKTQELMRRIDAITVATCELQADLNRMRRVASSNRQGGRA